MGESLKDPHRGHRRKIALTKEKLFEEALEGVCI